MPYGIRHFKEQKRPNELAIWKARVAELNAKEARCPGCIKAKKEAENATLPGICEFHRTARRRMVFG